MNIQRLSPADLTTEICYGLADLFGHRAWERGMYPYSSLTKKDWWRDEAFFLVSAERIISFAYLDGKNVLGHAALVKKGKIWECGRWAVDPRHQGKKIGSNLVRACVAYAETHGIKWFTVGCSYYQSYSELICRSLGMSLLGVHPDIYTTRGASWGETLFIWRKGKISNPKELTRDQVRSGVVGLRVDERGEWEEIRTRNLPRFETVELAGPIRGRVPIHTTRETLDFMKR